MQFLFIDEATLDPQVIYDCCMQCVYEMGFLL